MALFHLISLGSEAMGYKQPINEGGLFGDGKENQQNLVQEVGVCLEGSPLKWESWKGKIQCHLHVVGYENTLVSGVNTYCTNTCKLLKCIATVLFQKQPNFTKKENQASLQVDQKIGTL